MAGLLCTSSSGPGGAITVAVLEDPATAATPMVALDMAWALAVSTSITCLPRSDCVSAALWDIGVSG